MRTSTLLSFLILFFAAVDSRAQCDPALIVPPDGTAIPNDIVISEVNPGLGGYIEIYNRTGNIVSLNGWWFCSPFVYSPLGATSIGPYSYKTYPWPGTFSDDDAQGEIMLYDSAAFGNSNDIIDYVPWGASNLFRFGQADAVNKWSGGAAPVLVNGAIHRITNTTGTTAADYDVTVAPSPQNCAGLPTGIGDAPAYPTITLAISPNPFSSLATISFDLSSTAEVSGAVYSVTGTRVRTLDSSVRNPGAGRLFWDGRDDAGNEVPSGTYLVKVTANSAVATQRVTVLR
jgi:hypothetical protein